MWSWQGWRHGGNLKEHFLPGVVPKGWARGEGECGIIPFAADVSGEV